jgi:TatA/E family protein of Tat protein translocase
MFGIGLPELIVILALALIVFGPEKLPEIAAQLGRTMRDFRRMTEDITGEFSRTLTVDPPPAPLHGEPAPAPGQGAAGARPGPGTSGEPFRGPAPPGPPDPAVSTGAAGHSPSDAEGGGAGAPPGEPADWRTGATLSGASPRAGGVETSTAEGGGRPGMPTARGDTAAFRERRRQARYRRPRRCR